MGDNDDERQRRREAATMGGNKTEIELNIETFIRGNRLQLLAVEMNSSLPQRRHYDEPSTTTASLLPHC